MAGSRTPWSAWNGLGFGLVAGGVFALAECVAAWVGGQGVLTPVRFAASVLLGARALADIPLGLMVASGLAVGMLFAVGVFLVTFQLMGRGGLLFAAAERRRVAIAVFEQHASEERTTRQAGGGTPD
jgi:hypothetical protein